MAKVKLDGWRCERCQHQWVPRDTTKGEPTVCPSCSSPYWNKPRQDGETKTNIVKRGISVKG